MKYIIELEISGRAYEVVGKRNDLVFLTDMEDIRRVCKDIGWEHLDEEYPTGIWVQSVDGEYGDIFITFARSPYYVNVMAYKVHREWVEETPPIHSEAVQILLDLWNNWPQYDDEDRSDPRLTLIEKFLSKEGLIDEKTGTNLDLTDEGPEIPPTFSIEDYVKEDTRKRGLDR